MSVHFGCAVISGCAVVSVLVVLISTSKKVWYKISAPPALPNQLSYGEYIDRTLSVGR